MPLSKPRRRPSKTSASKRGRSFGGGGSDAIRWDTKSRLPFTHLGNSVETMKFTILALSALATAALYAQTPQELAPYAAGGHRMAQDAYIAQGGGTRVSTAGKFVYSSGPIMGLTKAEAAAKFEKMWAATSPQVRANWAKKAMQAGMTPDVIAGQDAANAAADVAAEKARKAEELDHRLRKLEKAEHDRQN